MDKIRIRLFFQLYLSFILILSRFFRTQFIDKWDSAHLSKLQSDWDDDNVEDETSEDKIARLGARPTTYTSP